MIDASGTGNDGDLYTGRTMAFDGTNDVITIGDTSQNVKTVVFWVWPDTTTEKFMQLQASGAVDIGITSGTLSGTGWTSPTYYVNGVAGTSVSSGAWQMIAVTSATAIDASDVKLGLSNADYFDGKLSNVIFYGSELTANQVAQLYALPESPIPSGLGAGDIVGWWTLAESTAPGIALDGSGNNNNGAISGASDLLAQNGAVPQWGFKGNSWPMWWDFTDDVVLVNSMVPTQSFSISFWIYAKSISGRGFFTWATNSPSGFFAAQISSNGAISISDGVNENINSNSSVISAEKIAFIVITMNTSNRNINFYVDGINVGNLTFTDFTWGATTAYYSIGRRFTSVFYDGIIYNHGNWDSILSANEVAALYAAGIDHDLRVATGNYTSTANLQGYWVNTGNQNSDWLDLSGNGNNGTVNGSPGRIFLPEGLTPGKDVVGMTVDNPVNGEMYVPDNGYIVAQHSASLSLGTAFTLEMWIKFDYDFGQTLYYFFKLGALRVGFTTLKRLQVTTYRLTVANVYTSPVDYYDISEWMHSAIVYDNSTLRIYKNGVLFSSAAMLGAIDDGTQLYTSYTSFAINAGYIDDVRIYNVALTADQVANNYNATKASHSN